MKKYGYSIAVVLMVIMFAVSAVFISMMPEQIPVHYGASGVADRFGSRFECLIFPLFSFVFGIGMLALSKCQRNKENGSEKVHLICTNIILIFFNIIQVYFFLLALSYREGSKDFVADTSFVSIMLGAMFMILGNFMPKVTRNKHLGIRFSWTMKNDVCWQKSHRFGGVLMLAAGLLLIMNGLFLNATACSVIILVIVLLMVIVMYIGTYMICKKVECNLK